MGIPQPGQKTIPLKDWQRFLRVADWWDRTFGHRVPGALPTVPGQSVLVKTPSGGIDARSGTTIYSATCTKCVPAESATAGQKTIHETTDELQVYNVADQPVPGDIYVETVLTPNGNRQVVSSGLALVGITLTEDMGATTAGEASCTVQPTWDPATEAYTGSTASQVAVDSKGVFADAVSGAVGLALRRQGNSRIVYEIIQLSCEAPE